MDEIILTLNNPLTEEQWDAITDVDFDSTDKIYFNTKHGKEVCFVKQNKGKWNRISLDKYTQHAEAWYRCDQCGETYIGKTNYCPNCGAEMEGKANV